MSKHNFFTKVIIHFRERDLIKWFCFTLWHHIKNRSHIIRSWAMYKEVQKEIKRDYGQSTWNIWLYAAYKSFNYQKPKVISLKNQGKELLIKAGRYIVFWPAQRDFQGLTWLSQEVDVPFWRNPHSYNKRGFSIKPRMTVIDFGACEGFFTLMAAKKAATVFSIEPNPELAKLLKKTISYHGYQERVKVISKAFDNKSYEGNFELKEDISTSQLSANKNGINVHVTTLDEFAKTNNLKQLDLIKLDVEGWEERILEGGKQTIRSFKPKIAAAVYHDPSQAQRVKAVITGIDPTYQFNIRGLALRPSAKDIPRPMMLFAW